MEFKHFMYFFFFLSIDSQSKIIFIFKGTFNYYEYLKNLLSNYMKNRSMALKTGFHLGKSEEMGSM